MDLAQFKRQFAGAKEKMTLDEAYRYISGLLEGHPMFLKGWFNEIDFNHRLMVRVACESLLREIKNASPWESYQEIFARLEYPCMKRVLEHDGQGYYKGPDGQKWGEADAYFLELWLSYHYIFCYMPGKTPDLTCWRMYFGLLNEYAHKMKKFRRKL